MKQGQHNSVSYWLETCGDNLEPRTPLNTSIYTDVAILGAGFTGLWTAYYLTLKYPSLNIVILEKEITGYGGSGRNGGWCSPKFSVTPGTAIKRYGLETAKKLQLTMIDSVYEVERVIREEKIDADWALSGSLQVALGGYGTSDLEKSMETYRALGVEDHFQLLNKDQTEDHIHLPKVEGSVFTKPSAVLNPGKLVRQLANVLEKRGVKIYEQTEVTNIIHGSAQKGAKLVTRNGSVTADHAIVLAGEAYMTQLPKFRRHLVPMYSLVTMTEPLNEEQWAAVGWKGRETIGTTRLSLDYMQKTADGRILLGGRGQPYKFASKISPSLDYHEETHNLLKNRLIQWFPALEGIQFTHDWGGPVGMTRDWTPNFFYNRQTKVAGAWGYVGQGVSTANLAGRILSDVLLEKNSSLTTLPMFQHQSKKWEPEPFRWAGVRFVQSSLGRIDEKVERSGIAPNGKTLAERISRH